MEIKPCPFCGSSNCEEIYQNGRDEGWVVRCNWCGATGAAFAYDQDAVGKWNDVALACGSPAWQPIKPCPLCGGEAVVDNDMVFTFKGNYVVCRSCGLSTGENEHADDAIKAWNSIGLSSGTYAKELNAGAWQPIETAPKDGTEVLASTYKGVATVFWDIEEGRWCFVSQIVPCCAFLKSTPPTHWMPLPPPPKP